MLLTRKQQKLLTLVIVIGFALYQYWSTSTKKQVVIPPTEISKVTIAPQPMTQAVVKRVVDGDTIELEDGRKVRYVGVNTPETHHPKKPVECFGVEAAAKNKELVEGKTVLLAKDVSETDKYGRLLRFVYLPDPIASHEALFVNKYLVEEGYALTDTFPPDVAKSKEFVAAERFARDHNKGLWSSCEVK